MTGLILVFDLDQSIIDSNSFTLQYGILKRNNWNHIGAYLNMELVNTILKPAVKLRENKAGVDAIFLLSNNNSSEYVIHVIHYLNLILGVNQLFDYVMIRTHPSRPRSDNPPKSLRDIQYMMEHAIIPIAYSDTSRIYFFDDNSKHQIRKELEVGHYIEIRGPDLDVAGNNKGFIVGKPDLSDYRQITHVLDTLESHMSTASDPPYLSLYDTLPLSESLVHKKPSSKRSSLFHGDSRKKRKTSRKTRKVWNVYK